MKKNNWFFESTVPGTLNTIRIGIKVKKKIFLGKSPYQKIEIIDTFSFGRILVLDGIIQLSQLDDFIYHEILTHSALFSHPYPKNILIIGGGDGGCLREVLKHPIKEAYLVDIDKKVIEVSKKYLPFVSRKSFQNRRVRVLIEDGIKFVKKYRNFFDVVIIDSTDPIGPSLGLFSSKFYQDIFKALTSKGVLIVQSGCVFEQFRHLRKIYDKLNKIFPSVKIHKACIPCFQCMNEYSFTMAAKFNLDRIKQKQIEAKFKKLKLKLKYYGPDIHFASKILPRYLKNKLNIKNC